MFSTCNVRCCGMNRCAAVKAKHLWGVLLEWVGDLVAKIVFREFIILANIMDDGWKVAEVHRF